MLDRMMLDAAKVPDLLHDPVVQEQLLPVIDPDVLPGVPVHVPVRSGKRGLCCG